jgi:hypothetical protein
MEFYKFDVGGMSIEVRATSESDAEALIESAYTFSGDLVFKGKRTDLDIMKLVWQRYHNKIWEKFTIGHKAKVLHDELRIQLDVIADLLGLTASKTWGAYVRENNRICKIMADLHRIGVTRIKKNNKFMTLRILTSDRGYYLRIEYKDKKYDSDTRTYDFSYWVQRVVCLSRFFCG